MDDLEDHDQPLDFSNVLGDEDDHSNGGGMDDFGEEGNGGVVDFLGGMGGAGAGGGSGLGFGGDEGEEDEEEGDEEEEDEEDGDGDGDEDDEEEEEEVELTVDDEGRIVFDGGEMDYAVRSFPGAFDLSGGGSSSSSVLESVLADCARVRSAKAQNQEGEYSEGDTYFLRADEEPTTRLEGIARSVFEFHTQHAAFDPSRSGAEWWVQVLDEDDDIGLHFDKDYDLEECSLNIHPHVATVTYLTDHGGPTMILPCPGPLQHGEDLTSSFRTTFLSLPQRGKHTSFDGRFLHAAPAELQRLWKGTDDDPDANGNGNGHGEDGEETSKKRVTLLVNVWLNHLPNSAERPGKKLLAQLAPNDPPLPCTLPTTHMTEQQRAALVMRGRGKPKGGNGGAKGGKGKAAVGAAEGAVAEVEVTAAACRTARWIFRGEAKQRYAVTVPVPLDGSVPLRSEGASSTVQLLYEEEGLEGEIMRDGKRKRGDDSEGGSEEEEEEEGEEEEEEEEEEEDEEEGDEDEESGGGGVFYDDDGDDGDEGSEDEEDEEEEG